MRKTRANSEAGVGSGAAVGSGAGVGSEAAGGSGAAGGESGSDLHLDLDLTPGGGPRASLTRALRDAIRTGRLAPGTRLPASRTLAADLGLARNTVVGAYGELVAEGWLVARQGSGTRVARRPEPTPPPRPGRRPVRALPAGLERWAERFPHDLRTGGPDISAFPRQAWLASARRALTAAPASSFGHGDLRGTPELRRALADYLARARGVRTDPERIVVCAGFAQGITLLSRVMPGEAAVEEHGLPFHRDLLAAGRGRTCALPLDEHGARVSALDDDPALAAVRAVLLTPAHQYPTGASLHPDRRAAVVDWASRTGGVVLEDDYDGEFRYDRNPVGALQGLDPEHVVHLGTSSKALAPALRLSWMVLPDRLVDAVLAAKTPAEWSTGALDQLTLADFLDRGAYDRHVRVMRQRYRSRRDRLVAALGARAPRVRATGIAAGLHAVLELSPGVTESTAVAATVRRGVGTDVLSAFRHPAGRAAHSALVVGYGTPPDHAFPSSLEALCDALAPLSN
ncbi:PLP-dependent aminotransferase family protein [Streptomyces albiaxialis]|uniref:PLP-dependent aminotransferase family protein n=1 Tax=Streptomyces albiaxialis TaxID=329523 RepID=A0ABP5HFY4_9ACTN